MKRYALVNQQNIVENIILWDKGNKSNQWSPPDGYNLIEVTDNMSIAVGYIYDSELEQYIPNKPQEYPSFIFNKDIWEWEPPIPRPDDDNKYEWNEEKMEWVFVPDENENNYIDLDSILSEMESSGFLDQ